MTRAITALNGRLPASVLTGIGGGFRLRVDAAASYARMRAAGMPAGITSAYRTYEQQAKLRAAYEKGAGGLAERPGRSWHGEGLALDLPEPARSWAARYAAPFGWRRTISVEPWHFEYFPDRDTREDDDMSAADVAAIRADIAKLKTTVDDLLTQRARYQLRNPLTGAITPTLDALKSMWDYSIRAYLEANAAKKAAQGQAVDVAEVAAALAPILVDAVAAAAAQHVSLTPEQVRDATERAMRDVLGSLG